MGDSDVGQGLKNRAGLTTAFTVRAEAPAGQDLCLIPRTFVEQVNETSLQQVPLKV